MGNTHHISGGKRGYGRIRGEREGGWMDGELLQHTILSLRRTPEKNRRVKKRNEKNKLSKSNL